MADVKWIKICTDIFDDEKMTLLDAMPEHDAIIVIWFKLLCMAGKQNNGGVFLMNDKLAYTDEMLATIFRRPINIVRLALTTFEQFGMIEIVNNAYTIPNWEKHQNLDRLETLKEQTRLRVAKHREKQRLLSGEECNVTVTLCNDTDKIRLEEDKEKDIYKDKYIEIINYLNEKTKSKYRASNKTTQKHINARLKEGYSVEDFKTVIDKKCAEWVGTNMEQYLRPETLFGTKFESYLNSKVSNKSAPNKNDGWCYAQDDDLSDLF